MYINRREFLFISGTLLFTNSSFAGTLKTPWQSAGPFYPDREPDDLDNNLVNIGLQGVDAEGIKLDIFGTITNPEDKPLSDLVIEIWQTDKNGIYIHSSALDQKKRDKNFQGFGKTKSDLNGTFEFKTILPVAYFGRPPHIHLLVRDDYEIKLITQLYFENHPLNESDFLFKKMNPEEKKINTLILNRKFDKKNALTSNFQLIL